MSDNSVSWPVHWNASGSRVTRQAAIGKQQSDKLVKANTPRQKSIHKAVRELIPLVPYSDFVAIVMAARSKHMRSLTPVNGAYLATIARIRHQHTDYDQLRDEGYDHDSARFFVADAIEDKLREWGSSRGLDGEFADPETVT